LLFKRSGTNLRLLLRYRHLFDFTWRHDHAGYALMRLKGAAAVDVLALVVAFFGLVRDVTATARVGSALTQRTMHHL